MSEWFEVDLIEEICCEVCNEVVHFHMSECPACHFKYAETDQYCSVNDCIQDNDGKLSCKECGAKFQTDGKRVKRIDNAAIS